jgi:tripeptide aminopeptidase
MWRPFDRPAVHTYHIRIMNAIPFLHDMQTDRSWFETDIVDRFTRYVRVHTTSDSHSASTPSTVRQFDLARMLEAELKELGLDEVELTDECFLFAWVPGTGRGVNAQPVGFMAHIDTTEASSGENVQPRVHTAWDGEAIRLKDGFVLDPADDPALGRYRGETVITSDGTTLLGADDKAGVAEIMTAVAWLQSHPEISHAPVQVIFTPDEETGKGMERFPRDKVRAPFCVTLDGGEEGSIEYECFTAYRVIVQITGRVEHPGHARGKLINAVSLAGRFIAMLPGAESPEATDDRYGYYCATEVTGELGKARIELIVRDFEEHEVQRRVEYLRFLGECIEKQSPGARLTVTAEKQYTNMRDAIQHASDALSRVDAAVRATGITPMYRSIRGGTDGARLTELGVPTPNLFCGSLNIHGCTEWVALPAMVRAAKTVINTVLVSEP